MTEYIWQIPNNSDSRYGDNTSRKRGERLRDDRPAFTDGVSDPRGTRFNYLDYLLQIARAADFTGFNGIHIQNQPDGDEPWIIAGYLANEVTRLKIITEFDANRGSAVYAAKNAMTFQRYTRGRFAWHIQSLSEEYNRLRYADKASADDILPRIDEFIQITKGIVTGTEFNFKGDYFEVLNGGFKSALSKQKVPEIYLAYSDHPGLALSAKHADVHIFDIQSTDHLAEKIAHLNKLKGDRSLRFAVRLNVIARDDLTEALYDAQPISAQQEFKGNDASLIIHEAALNGTKGTVLGSYDGVTELLAQYAHIGISTFIFGGSPHLEEAYRVGENLLPRLKQKLGASI
jgi:alkanesulfonate monooxygenase